MWSLAFQFEQMNNTVLTASEFLCLELNEL